MIESKQKNAVQVLESQFAERKDQFLAVLPTNCTFEKFERVVKTAVIQNQDLLSADRTSLFLACFKCAQDGLLPDGRESALVMYGKNVQYMPMIGGILKKIRNSGELLSISAHVVYELDEFDYCLGDNERIDHKPASDERGRPICAYAIVKTKDNAIYREVMSVKEIDAIRSISRAKGGTAWTHHWAEMAKKTVIRRLSKRLPMCSDIDQIIRRDDEMYEFDNSNNFNRNKNSVIDQINAQLENKSAIEELQENGCLIIDDPKANELSYPIEIKEGDRIIYEGKIHVAGKPMDSRDSEQEEDDTNPLPFISRGELNRYIAGAKAGKCTWKELGEKYQMTKEDRLHALGQGAAILIEPGSI